MSSELDNYQAITVHLKFSFVGSPADFHTKTITPLMLPEDGAHFKAFVEQAVLNAELLRAENQVLIDQANTLQAQMFDFENEDTRVAAENQVLREQNRSLQDQIDNVERLPNETTRTEAENNALREQARSLQDDVRRLKAEKTKLQNDLDSKADRKAPNKHLTPGYVLRNLPMTRNTPVISTSTPIFKTSSVQSHPAEHSTSTQARRVLGKRKSPLLSERFKTTKAINPVKSYWSGYDDRLRALRLKSAAEGKDAQENDDEEAARPKKKIKREFEAQEQPDVKCEIKIKSEREETEWQTDK